MSNLVTVNSGSAVNGSLKAGRVSISTDSSITPTSGGKTWYNMINPAEGYVFITDNKIQAYGDGVPLIYPTQTSLPADILATINGLPDRVGSVPFDNVWDALKWTGQSGKYFTLKNTLSGIPSDGLVFYVNADSIVSYPQDDTIWYDLSGNDYHLTVTNSPVFNPDGYFENDVDSYFTGPGGANIPTGNDPYTMVVLARQVEQWGSADGFISIGGFYTTNQSNALRTLNNNVGHFHHYWWGNDLSLQSNAAGLALGKWFMVAASFDGTTRRIWVNGISRVSAGASNHNVTSTTIQVSKTVSTEYQEGDVSEAFIYDKALSSDEMLQLYYKAPIVTEGLALAVDAGNLVSYENGASTTYSLTGSLSGTLYNNPGYSSDYGGIFISDGTDDGIVVPDDNTLDLSDFTLEAWVWWNRHKNYGSLLCKGPGGSGGVFNYCFFFYSGNIVCGFGNGSAFYNVSISTPTTNEWHHIVGTYDGATLKFYLDGVLATSSGIVQTPYQNATDLGLLHTPYPIDGKVGPLRIYNRAITAEEVAQNHNAEYPRFKSSRDIPKDGLVLDLDAANPNSYLSGTTWTDLSGQGNNGTLNNGVGYTTDNGGALTWDGADDTVSVGNIGTIGNTQTISVWFNSSAVENYRNVLDMNYSTYSPNTGNTGPRLEQYTNGNLTWIWSGNTTNNNIYNTVGTGTIVPNTWYNAVFVQNSGNVSLYLNGVLTATNASPNGYLTTYSDVVIGRGFVLDPSRYFAGKESSVKIWDRALSAAEVSNLYTSTAPRHRVQLPRSTTDSLVLNLDAGDTTSYPRTGTTWYDRSGNGYNNTLYNGPEYNFVNGGSITFDGTNDYSSATLTGANFDSTGFTLETWVKLLNEPGAWRSTFNIKNASNVKHIDIRNSNGFGTMTINYYPAASDITAGSVNIPENEWFHLVGVWDTQQLKLYVNGYQSGSIANMTSLDLGTSPIFQVGRAYDGTRYINDEFSMIKVYNRGLSPSEVLENYKSTRSRFGTDGIVTSNLVLNLDSGDINSFDNSSTSIYDLSGNGNDGILENGAGFSPSNSGIINLDGTDDRIRVPNTSGDFNFGTGNFTISLWINPSYDTTYPHLYALDNQYNFCLKAIRFDVANPGRLYVYQGYSVMFTNSYLTLNTWQMITLTRNSQTHKMYINGQLTDTVVDGSGPKNITGSDVYLGWGWASEYTPQGRGPIQVYNTDLSDAQILQNYKAQRNRFGLD